MSFHAEILTLFPSMVWPYLRESILGRAAGKGLATFGVTDIRDFAEGKHRVVDDAPFGGGAGMVMKAEPVVRAIEAAKAGHSEARVLLMSPRGRAFTQRAAQEWSKLPALVLVCGRYEGLDERVRSFVDDEVSVGDFVLTGGELPALTIVDAVVRLLPGALGNSDSSRTESFEADVLEYPQYTRPPDFRGLSVPVILQGGDHARIERWRRLQSLLLTASRRPDLFARVPLSKEDCALLKQTES